MTQELTQQDKEFIWKIVDLAVERAGSHTQLFANRLDFFDESGRIRFRWPVWMDAIKGYLIAQYGEKKADACLLSILREVMSEPNYHAYLRKQNQVDYAFKFRQNALG
ncbi:hypothetical protein [Aliikangiella maris]|uniref:Uncharacterized protein n=2 Tax=Aliikangiella maris TaxID=3162458 RepID=A0ABV2BZD7_9GAMM